MSRATPLRAIEVGPGGVATLSAGHDDDSAGLLLDGMAPFLREFADVAESDELVTELSEVMGNPREMDVARANLLRALTLNRDMAVLEIGCGWGTLTRYLGERVRIVDAVTSRQSDALYASARVNDLDSVRIFQGVVADIPDRAAYDLVVVSDPDQLGWAAEDQSRMKVDLAEISRRLTDDGEIVIVVTNSLGVKYQAGGTDRPPLEGASELSRLSIASARNALAVLGFSVNDYSVFPDAWSPRVVMDVQRLAAEAPILLQALPNFPSPDPEGSVPRSADEAALWRSWIAAGQSDSVVNAALVIGSRSSVQSLWPENRLATYWSVGRSAEQSAENKVERVNSEKIIVRRESAFGLAPSADSLVTFTPGVEDFEVGDDFVAHISQAVDERAASSLLARWVSMLVSQADSPRPVLWDLVPHNLVISDGSLRAIDQEWVLSGTDWMPVLRRGSFWLVSRLAERRLIPDWLHGETIADAALYVGSLVGLGDTGNWLETFFAEEAEAVASTLRPDARFAPQERIFQLAAGLRTLSAQRWDAVARPQTLADVYLHLTSEGSPAMPSEPASITQSIGRTRSELLARERELEEKEVEIAERAAELIERDSHIESLNQTIDTMRSNERHVALVHRDHVIGLEAQLATARSEQRAAAIEFEQHESRSIEIGEGFANALAILEVREAEIVQLSSQVEQLQGRLRAERNTSKNRARELKELRASSTWRIGRVFVRPFSIFKR